MECGRRPAPCVRAPVKTGSAVGTLGGGPFDAEPVAA